MAFNPFKYIFILEGFLKDESLYDKDKLIHIMDFIEANKGKSDCIPRIDEEMKRIATDQSRDSSGSGSTDIKARINETITSLKKMCNSENMMETFMEIIYLIEKPHGAK